MTGTGGARRDGPRTRARILKAATAEFATYGYDGARVERIVARAKVSKNLIYHYFQSKERLYLEVLERTYGAMRERQDALALTGLDPVEGMERLIRDTFRHFVETPEMISLMNTENLHKARHLRKSATVRALYPPLLTAIGRLLEEGRAAGLFREQVDVVDLYISISALGYFYLSNRHTLSYLLGDRLDGPERLAQRLDHIVEMVMSYLRPPPPVSRRAGKAFA